MNQYRNSQKRIHQPDRIYYTVSKTHQNYPYFKESIFCELLIDELRLCKQLKKFGLLAFSIMYDHLNLMVQTNEKMNISHIMKSIKKQFSHNANCVMGFNEIKQVEHGDMHNSPESDKALCRLQGNYACLIAEHKQKTHNFKDQFIHKYRDLNINKIPKFKWQKSFHDHIIRGEKDYYAHYYYTIYNHLKHKLPKNWPYTSLNYIEDKKLIDVVWW